MTDCQIKGFTVASNTHVVVPTSSLLFFVLPQRKVTKESGTFGYSSAAKSSYTAHNPDSADTAIADQIITKNDSKF